MKIKNDILEQPVKWVRILAVLSTLIMMFYAPKLWISTKDFPTIPLFDNFTALQYPFDYILAGLFFMLHLIYLFYPKRIIGFSIVLLFIFLAVVDQTRLQPYFYQNILTIFAISLFPKTTQEKKVLYAIILIFIATYFWSGIQKFNDEFYIQWMRALLKHFDFVPHSLLLLSTYAVPWVEFIIGIFLLFNKTRKLGVISIVLMHGTIVFMLYFLGYGYNVVIWNLQNILSVIIIFWTLKTERATSFFVEFFDYRKAIVIIFTFILPLSNIFGKWDHLLSFSFFSAKLNYYYVEIDKKLTNKLPKHIQDNCLPFQDKQILYVHYWCGNVNKVLFYPEDRCIQYLDNYLKSFADNPKEEGLTKLVIWNH